MAQFDVKKITEYVQEILLDAGLSDKHAGKFVEMSLASKKRFHHMQFDEFGRRHIHFTVTPQILLNDYTWFRLLLDEMGIMKEHLAVVMGKIYVMTARGGGAPLTKELAKNKAALFSRGKKWFNHYEYKNDIMNKPDAFLCRLGDVINLGKKAVVSINPGDILRKSMGGKYSAYTSCHNLASGAHRQGPVCYALDPNHLITYITDGGDQHEKMHGRSMMVISNDLNVVAMRRFYPSPDVFGESRAKAIREEVHHLIAPDAKWMRSKNTGIIQPTNEAINGYMDAIAVATYADPDKKFQDVELNKEVFCFGCGTLHTRQNIMCGKSSCKQNQARRY